MRKVNVAKVAVEGLRTGIQPPILFVKSGIGDEMRSPANERDLAVLIPNPDVLKPACGNRFGNRPELRRSITAIDPCPSSRFVLS